MKVAYFPMGLKAPFGEYPPHSKLLLTEVNHREWRYSGNALSGFGEASDATPLLRPYRYPQDLDNKSLLFLRAGGFGDLLFLTPTIRALREKFPNATFGICAFNHFLEILEAQPLELLRYPCTTEELQVYDYHADLENIIENNPTALTTPAVDCIAAALGLELAAEDRKPEFRLPFYLEPVADEVRVAIHLDASSPIRCYPPQFRMAVIEALLAEGFRVYHFGSEGQAIPWRRQIQRGTHTVMAASAPPAGFVEFAGAIRSIRVAAAMLTMMDALVSVDSAFVQVAGILGLPTIALYGPFPARLRCDQFPTVRPLEGKLDCAPCFAHGTRLPCERPACAALQAISPDVIVANVIELVKAKLQSATRCRRSA